MSSFFLMHAVCSCTAADSDSYACPRRFPGPSCSARYGCKYRRREHAAATHGDHHRSMSPLAQINQEAAALRSSSNSRHSRWLSLGAGTSKHLQRAEALVRTAHSMGFKIKLNTVVCKVNALDDMNALAMRLAPHRWKVFQVLPVEGQNDGVGLTGAPPLFACTALCFHRGLSRHIPQSN